MPALTPPTIRSDGLANPQGHSASGKENFFHILVFLCFLIPFRASLFFVGLLFLPGVKLQSLRELRVVVVVVVVVVVLVVMWCFYLPGHLTTTFAKQLL